MGHARPSHRQSDIPMSAHKTTPHKTDIAELELFEGLGMESVFVVTERAASRARPARTDAGGNRGLRYRVEADLSQRPEIRRAACPAVRHPGEGLHFPIAFRREPPGDHRVARNRPSSPRSASAWAAISTRFPTVSASGPPPSWISTARSSSLATAMRSARSRRSPCFSTASSRNPNPSPPRTGRRGSLSERQLLYAANDAYAAIRVFHALRELSNPGTPES